LAWVSGPLARHNRRDHENGNPSKMRARRSGELAVLPHGRNPLAYSRTSPRGSESRTGTGTTRVSSPARTGFIARLEITPTIWRGDPAIGISAAWHRGRADKSEGCENGDREIGLLAESVVPAPWLCQFGGRDPAGIVLAGPGCVILMAPVRRSISLTRELTPFNAEITLK
jgi:hypothetical protein